MGCPGGFGEGFGGLGEDGELGREGVGEEGEWVYCLW